MVHVGTQGLNAKTKPTIINQQQTITAFLAAQQQCVIGSNLHGECIRLIVILLDLRALLSLCLI